VQIQERNLMTSSKRIFLAFVISFPLSVVISLVNEQGLVLSLQSGFVFSIIVTFIVSILSWGIDIAVKKGYPKWAGFLFVLIFNVFGLAFLAILPNKKLPVNQI
jgi:hypothetical protein